MADIHCHVNVDQALSDVGLDGSDAGCTTILAGEANDGANVGTGEGEVYRDKTGVTLNFRTLEAGVNTTIVTDGDVVRITAGGGITGPNPSTLRAIATYADEVGGTLYDNEVRIEDSQAGSDYRTVQILDSSVVPGVWKDAIQVRYQGPNGTPGGAMVQVGSAAAMTEIVGETDPYAVGPGGRGKIIHERINVPWTVRQPGSIMSEGPDTDPVFALYTEGLNAGITKFYIGDRDPQGQVTAAPGSMYVRQSLGTSNMYQHRGVASTNSDWVELGSVDIAADEVSIQLIGIGPIVSVQDAINQFGMAGSSQDDGPYIVDAGGSTVDIAGGFGWLRAVDAQHSELFAVSWSALSGQAIPPDTTRYIGVEYNGGSPQITVRTSEDFDRHTDFRLGTVVNQDGVLHVLNNTQWASSFGSRIFERLFETRPLERAHRLGGIIPSSSGRNILVSAGELYDGFQEFDIDSIDTSSVDTFDAYYRDGSGGWTLVGAQSLWDNANYDDGTGVLDTLTANRYSMHWLYIEADGDLVLLYGQGEWTTEGDAETQPRPATVPPRIGAHGRLFGRIVYQEGGANALSVVNIWEAIFAAVSSSGDVHGPATATDEAIVLFDGGTGKLVKNSPARINDVTDIHRIQIQEPLTPFTWIDAIQVVNIPANGLPGGQYVGVGSNGTNPLILTSSADPWVLDADAPAAGRLIHEKIQSDWEIERKGIISQDNDDTEAPLTLANTGTNPASVPHYVGNRDPIGNVTAGPGSMYTRVNGSSSRVYQHRGTASNNTDWVDITAAGGASLGETWTFSTATSGDPGSKKFLLNNATQSSATAIHISDTADNGVDFSTILLRLKSGDALYIQQGDDSTRYHVLSVTGDAVDQVTYVQVPVSVDDSGLDLVNNKKCPMLFLFSGSGSGTGAPNVGFYASKIGGNQTLSSGVETQVIYDTKRDDAGADFSTSTYRFTAPTAGRYMMTASTELTLAAAGRGELRMYTSVHGRVAESSDHENTAGTVKPNIAAALQLDASETVEIRAFQNSGFTATIQNAFSNFTGLQVMEI